MGVRLLDHGDGHLRGPHSTQDPPTRPELIGFALAGVAAFSLLNPLAVYPPSSRSGAEPTPVLLLATATDFLAVGGGVGTAMGINAVSSVWWAWVLAPFCAGLVYVLVQCIELTVGQHTDEATRTLRLLPAAADGGSPHLPEGPRGPWFAAVGAAASVRGQCPIVGRTGRWLQVTGFDDVSFDLISVQYHSLKAGHDYGQYVRDAENAGLDEVADFLRQVMSENAARAEACHRFLREMTGSEHAGPAPT